MKRPVPSARILRAPRRVYYSLLVIGLVLSAAAAPAQVEVTADAAMTRGSASAPVTIVEFSDYQ